MDGDCVLRPSRWDHCLVPGRSDDCYASNNSTRACRCRPTQYGLSVVRLRCACRDGLGDVCLTRVCAERTGVPEPSTLQGPGLARCAARMVDKQGKLAANK